MRADERTQVLHELAVYVLEGLGEMGLLPEDPDAQRWLYLQAWRSAREYGVVGGDN